MSFLDLYQGDQEQALRPQANEAHDLPATFGETFDASWNYGRLFGQSVSRENARMDALQDHIADIHQKSGVNIGEQMNWMLGAPGVSDVPVPSAMLLDQANQAVSRLKEKRPDLDIAPIDDDELEKRAVGKSQQAGAALAQVSQRERTLGGSLGLLAGGMANAATDPINILALLVAPEAESVSLVAAALRWGTVGAIAQGGIEAAGTPYREEVQPGYAASGAPLANVAEAFAGGAVLGGVTKGLGNLWTRVKTGAWPTSVRDAANVLESEANVADTNVYSGAAGEAAHRDALTQSVDQILKEQPVDVSAIITPDIEAGSRGLMIRLNSERAASLPAFDQRSIALLSEDAGLRAQDAEHATTLQNLPEGNATSADRLSRLQAVEQQLRTAEGDARKRLLERRDQILVDTTPEQLQAEAAPIAQRQQAEAARQQIATRLAEIETERTQARADALGTQPALAGQMQPARPFPSMDELRQLARSTGEIAAQERAIAPRDELPFEATAAEAQARSSADALSDGVRQIAERAGYAMPPEEAAQIAGRLTRMAPEDAQDALRTLQTSPRQALDTMERPPAFPEPTRPPVPNGEALKATLDGPEFDRALQSDIDRERVGDVNRKIPVDVDKDGNPVYRPLDELADEAEAYRTAADQIAACAAPAQPAEAVNG